MTHGGDLWCAVLPCGRAGACNTFLPVSGYARQTGRMMAYLPCGSVATSKQHCNYLTRAGCLASNGSNVHKDKMVLRLEGFACPAHLAYAICAARTRHAVQPYVASPATARPGTVRRVARLLQRWPHHTRRKLKRGTVLLQCCCGRKAPRSLIERGQLQRSVVAVFTRT